MFAAARGVDSDEEGWCSTIWVEMERRENDWAASTREADSCGLGGSRGSSSASVLRPGGTSKCGGREGRKSSSSSRYALGDGGGVCADASCDGQRPQMQRLVSVNGVDRDSSDMTGDGGLIPGDVAVTGEDGAVTKLSADAMLWTGLFGGEVGRSFPVSGLMFSIVSY